MPVSYNFQKPVNPLSVTPTDTVPKVLVMQLGSGFLIPFMIVNQQWQTISGLKKVQQDVIMAVLTPVGRRMVFPSFGSLVPYLMFEQVTPLLQQQIISTTTNAINTWVPTVFNVQVQIDLTNIQSDALGINIFYSIKGTTAKQAITIVLTTNPNLQLPPGNFVVNQQQLFRV